MVETVQVTAAKYHVADPILFFRTVWLECTVIVSSHQISDEICQAAAQTGIVRQAMR